MSWLLIVLARPFCDGCEELAMVNCLVLHRHLFQVLGDASGSSPTLVMEHTHGHARSETEESKATNEGGSLSETAGSKAAREDEGTMEANELCQLYY